MNGIVMGETHTTMTHALKILNERLKERGYREVTLTAMGQWIKRGEIASIDWYGTTLVDLKQVRSKAETYIPRKVPSKTESKEEV